MESRRRDGIFHWMEGSIASSAGVIPRVKTVLTLRDRLGTLMVRLGMGRGRYRVDPGLYAVGSPTRESHIFVTASYKLSFDSLRSQLAGRDGWILVLDTRGINIWCAAGKGTFGTDELVRRTEAVHLADIVSHRKLIVPQLGATGVSAHAVHSRSGWRVVYGPVRAADLPVFLDSGLKTTPEMRRVRFSTADRLILIPVELMSSARYLVLVVVCFLLLSGLGDGGFSVQRIQSAGMRSMLLILAAYLAGAAVVPALLPWIPGRAFSLKGAWAGLAVFLACVVGGGAGSGVLDNWAEAISWFLLIPAIASFLAMNFTGASTFTSLSGVRREMRFAVPAQIAAAAVGIGMWLTGRFI